jgi:hypothetical protein
LLFHQGNPTLERFMQAPTEAANLNEPCAPRCLTDHDRDLLRVVTGWHMPGEAMTPVGDSAGRPMLIPVLAWILADARRSGELAGRLSPGGFVAAAGAVNRSHSPSLRLSRAQMGAGFRHLAIGVLGFSAGRARAAGG